MPILHILTGVSKKTIMLSVIAILLLGGGGYAYISKQNQPPQYETATVTRQDIKETVPVTGKIVAAEEVDLAFETNGRVAEVKVKTGDAVETGAILATLNNTDARAAVAEAQANVSSANAALSRYRAAVSAAKADLAKLEKGSRDEEVAIARTKVSKAEQSLASAQRSYQTAQDSAKLTVANLYDDMPVLIQASFNHAENAVEQQADQFFNFPYGRPLLSFTTGDTRAQNSAETNMQLSQGSVDKLRDLSLENFSTEDQIDTAAIQTLAHLAQVNALLIDLTSTLNATNTLSATTAAEYASDIATARTNINGDITAIKAKQQAISAQRITNSKNLESARATVTDAEQNLRIAKDELALTVAGATKEQLDSARAAVQQAEANLAVQQADVSRAYAALQRQNAELQKNSLVAPFAGTITNVDITTGEIVSSNEPSISLISNAQFEIEASVPEADIANIVVGNKATFTLDAFVDSPTYEATVAQINPAETITEGIATYKIKLVLTADNTAAKPGMTADVTIITQERAGALVIPFRATKRNGSVTEATILRSPAETDVVTITTGIRDRAGNVEILGGLTEGQTIVVAEITE